MRLKEVDDQLQAVAAIPASSVISSDGALEQKSSQCAHVSCSPSSYRTLGTVVEHVKFMCDMTYDNLNWQCVEL